MVSSLPSPQGKAEEMGSVLDSHYYITGLLYVLFFISSLVVALDDGFLNDVQRPVELLDIRGLTTVVKLIL